MSWGTAHSALFGEFAGGSVGQVLVDTDEAAGQRSPSQIRLFTSGHEEHL